MTHMTNAIVQIGSKTKSGQLIPLKAGSRNAGKSMPVVIQSRPTEALNLLAFQWVFFSELIVLYPAIRPVPRPRQKTMPIKMSRKQITILVIWIIVSSIKFSIVGNRGYIRILTNMEWGIAKPWRSRSLIVPATKKLYSQHALAARDFALPRTRGYKSPRLCASHQMTYGG